MDTKYATKLVTASTLAELCGVDDGACVLGYVYTVGGLVLWIDNTVGVYELNEDGWVVLKVECQECEEDTCECHIDVHGGPSIVSDPIEVIECSSVEKFQRIVSEYQGA